MAPNRVLDESLEKFQEALLEELVWSNLPGVSVGLWGVAQLWLKKECSNLSGHKGDKKHMLC